MVLNFFKHTYTHTNKLKLLEMDNDNNNIKSIATFGI